MSITDWPIQERPREKLLSHGAAALSDAELLAIFIRTGIAGCTAVDLGRHLLQQFGSLRHIVAADHNSFCRARGLGSTKYIQIQAALEIAQRCLQQTLQCGDVIANPEDTRRYLTLRLRGYDHEVFAGLFLDNLHRVIRFEELSHGTINCATVHVREVVKKALSYNAAAMILAHNHPSGMVKPSAADKYITQQLKQALQLIDVRLLDHIIIGEGQTASLAEQGLL